VVAAAEVLLHQAGARGPAIQMLVQGVGVEGVGDRLGPPGIVWGLTTTIDPRPCLVPAMPG
jgi:hypothetical protein